MSGSRFGSALTVAALAMLSGAKVKAAEVVPTASASSTQVQAGKVSNLKSLQPASADLPIRNQNFSPGFSAEKMDEIPSSGFYLGIGGSMNVTNFGNLSSYSQGVSQSTNIDPNASGYGGITYGNASGSTSSSIPTSNGLSPSVQAGYYQKFTKKSNWLWGAKFGYNYINSDSQSSRVLVPQSGPYYGQNNGTLTGNVVIGSVGSKLTNQFALTPFIGRSYKRGYFYIGGGPTVSQLKITNTNVDGTALVTGVSGDVVLVSITDRDQFSFSSSSWVAGWQVLAGATYFINRSTFFDLSYSYSQTQNQSTPYSANFRGFVPRIGVLDEGTLSGNTNGYVSNQAITITLNHRF